MRASASDTSMALSVPVPSSTMSATSEARPSCAAGSAPEPPSTWTAKVTTGTLVCSTVRTCSPLGSTWRWMPGNVKDGGGPSAGSRRPIDGLARHQDTATGTEPGSASAARPRGTTLSTTRRSGRR